MSLTAPASQPSSELQGSHPLAGAEGEPQHAGVGAGFDAVAVESVFLRPSHAKDRRAGADRRGPLRPERLISARERFHGFGPARAFRIVDTCLILALASVICGLAQTGGLLSTPITAALPYVIGSGLLIWSLGGVGAYRFSASEGLSVHLLRAFAGFLPAACLLLVADAVGLPRHELVQLAAWLALSFAAVYVLHAGWWLLVSAWRSQGRLTPNIIVVGATRNAERLIQALIDNREANVIGVFDDRAARAPPNIRGVPVLGDTAALLGHRLIPFVDRIVITVPSSAQGRVGQIIERLRVLPNDIALFLDFEAGGHDATLSRLARLPLAHVSGAPRNESRAFWKRVQDLVFGGIALIPAVPIMTVIAIAIRLDTPGPVFFRQRRHGFNNEEIVVWKFRSMRQEAADATASRQVSAGDDRVTRIGRIIRNTSLDELPQLFNILKGEMSLVGPRPHAIGMKTGDTESARLVAEYAHRHRLKPGMTGWAAIKGSRGPVDTPESVRRRVALDVEYIERQSFWLDLYIIAVTVPCLLGDRHAVR